MDSLQNSLYPVVNSPSLNSKLKGMTRHAAEILEVRDGSLVNYRTGADRKSYLFIICRLPGLFSQLSGQLIIGVVEGISYQQFPAEILNSVVGGCSLEPGGEIIHGISPFPKISDTTKRGQFTNSDIELCL